MNDLTYTTSADDSSPVTRFLSGRVGKTIAVLRDGKATSLRLYLDESGRFYVRTGKRAATKEIISGHTQILLTLYFFSVEMA